MSTYHINSISFFENGRNGLICFVAAFAAQGNEWEKRKRSLLSFHLSGFIPAEDGQLECFLSSLSSIKSTNFIQQISLIIKEMSWWRLIDEMKEEKRKQFKKKGGSSNSPPAAWGLAAAGNANSTQPIKFNLIDWLNLACRRCAFAPQNKDEPHASLSIDSTNQLNWRS